METNSELVRMKSQEKGNLEHHDRQSQERGMELRKDKVNWPKLYI